MAQESNILSVGALIEDRYEILSLLGEGGMGLVYLVRDRKRPEHFAVKCLKVQDDLAPHDLLRFLGEAELWAGLGTHLHIVQAMSVNCLTQSHPLIFLEYVPGTSLRGTLQRCQTQLPIPRVMDYAIQICEGMAYAHQNGVIHRDLKPENVLVSFEGVKVTDFGIASVLQSTISHGIHRSASVNSSKIAGTLPYMSVEQLVGSEQIGTATDVYSFGVMLYELITGHRPFRGVTIDELRRAQRTSRPIVPSTFSEKEVPPLLDRVTMECLSLKADERPSFATMAQELKWAYDNEIGSEGPERSDRRWALLERAVALNNQRQPGAALAILKEVADEDPRDFNAWHLMGNALMQIGESQMPMDTAGEETRSLHDATASYRSAIWCAERSTELNPEHAWAWNTQGACLMSIGYFHRALCRLDRAIEIDPSYAIAWRTRGICLRRMGRLSDALESFDHALALEPHNANGLNGKGVCLGLLDLYPEALACFDEALRLVPNHIQALANRTLWEDLAAGDGDKIAITVSAYNPDVDEYLHRKLNIPDANRKGGRTARDLESAELADRAWGLMNVGLLNEAEKVIAEAIAIDSKYSTAWLQRGKILRRMGRIGEAIAAFEKTREIDPQYSLALLNEGLAHLDVGRLDHALELFKKYIAAEPNDSVGWNNRGLVFVKQQKYQDAIRSFAQSVRVDPTFSLGWFNKAQAHLSAGEIDSAYECCKQGLHLDPLNLGGLLVLGQTELKSGRLEAALAAFRGVTELDSSMANGWAHRALVESSYEAVMSCCQRAQELGFQDEELLLVAQGRGLMAAKRSKEALRVYNQLVKMNPQERAFAELKAVCEWQLQIHQELDSPDADE